MSAQPINSPASALSADKSNGRRSRATTDGPSLWLAAAILAVSIGIVYARSLNSPFILDDNGTVNTNTSIRSLWPLIGTEEHRGPLNPERDLPTAGRPLVNYSFALNYHFGGLNVVGYHVVNVAIHFLCALLLFAIVRRVLRLPYFAGRFDSVAGWLAFGAALLWSVHPLLTDAVAYLTQRTELMMAWFYLATLYCSIRYWFASPLPREREGRRVRVLRLARAVNVPLGYPRRSRLPRWHALQGSHGLGADRCPPIRANVFHTIVRRRTPPILAFVRRPGRHLDSAACSQRQLAAKLVNRLPLV